YRHGIKRLTTQISRSLKVPLKINRAPYGLPAEFEILPPLPPVRHIRSVRPAFWAHSRADWCSSFNGHGQKSGGESKPAAVIHPGRNSFAIRVPCRRDANCS